MILLLASIVDEAAVAFAKEFADVTAALVLACRDLTEERTILRYPDFYLSSLTVGGIEVPVVQIDGEINLLPGVLPDELFFYGAEEREYQASEFHALLTFFLSALKCPVVKSSNAVCSIRTVYECHRLVSSREADGYPRLTDDA